ncbi:hypothetical protein AAVH_08463 [Aphelenchoides avenae]|nr:hypothetical protein AAVH_08463 [Aphelenchus avenae]
MQTISLFRKLRVSTTHLLLPLLLFEHVLSTIPRENIPMTATYSLFRPARHPSQFLSKPRWDLRGPSLFRFRRNDPRVDKRRLGLRMPNIIYVVSASGGRFAAITPTQQYSA